MLSTRTMPLGWRWGAALGWAMLMQAQGVLGDFMSLRVTPSHQCGNATVTWSGDEGPWHLLLTPTDFVQHGYNLWVPEIPRNHTNWTIPIRQPAGMNYMITMWGASGIRYAGTTDILTVLPPVNATNASCYLNDTEILNQYTFSFNISDLNSGYPPQCSNLSMSWPTSLESPVTPSVARDVSPAERDVVEDTEDINITPFISNHLAALAARQHSTNDNPSSSDRTNGNTTKPPTMFGIIPMGNSFEIPITFSRQAAFAYKLPEDVISDHPSTWTRQGVTYLNWTIPLAKGTRFLLVAGIGDDQQWASGGSSRMLTVGQGNEDCLWPDDHGSVTTDVPSVTGSSTATPSINYPDDSTRGGSSSSGGGMSKGVIVACALSIAATLLVVGLCFCCFRLRRRRRAAAALTAFHDAKPVKRYPARGDGGGGGSGSESELPLDIISSRTASDQHYAPHQLSPIDTSPNALRGRPQLSPTHSDPFRDTPLSERNRYPRVGALRTEFASAQSPSPGTSTGTGTGTGGGVMSPISPGYAMAPSGSLTSMGRQASHEALLHSSLSSPTQSYPSTFLPLSARSMHNSHGTLYEERGAGTRSPPLAHPRDMPDLKRDVLAFLGDASGSGSGPGSAEPGGSGAVVGSMGPGSGSRRRRGEEEEEDEPADAETQYVVHRDAGRPRVMELPPRYEELNWEEERAAGAITSAAALGQGASGVVSSGAASSMGPASALGPRPARAMATAMATEAGGVSPALSAGPSFAATLDPDGPDPGAGSTEGLLRTASPGAHPGLQARAQSPLMATPGATATAGVPPAEVRSPGPLPEKGGGA